MGVPTFARFDTHTSSSIDIPFVPIPFLTNSPGRVMITFVAVTTTPSSEHTASEPLEIILADRTKFYFFKTFSVFSLSKNTLLYARKIGISRFAGSKRPVGVW